VEDPVDPEVSHRPPPPSAWTGREEAIGFGAGIFAVLALAISAGHGLAVPRWPWVAGVGVVALASCIVARIKAGATSLALWWAVVAVLSGGWLGWARFTDIKVVAPWLLLVVGVVALACWLPMVRKREYRLAEEAAQLAAERERQAHRNRWPRLLERIGHPGVQLVRQDETESGYVLVLRLAGTGHVTINKLRNDVERLEVAADVRRGSLHFEEGATARDVLLYVSTRDFLADTIPYVDDGELLSIQNPIPVGRYEDGTVCELTLREVAVLIVGLRGSGKSTLLNVLLAQLVRCVDVLVFCIDMKYRLVMPWVSGYLEDERNGMAVDWAATDRHEAELMLRAFVRGIEARAAAGVGEKIEPDPHQPAVFLVIDEIASIFGVGTGPRSSFEGTTNTTLAGIGTDAVRLGRSEAMDLIAASQRGTVTMLGTGDFKSQFPLRIGLRVQNEAEAQAVIPDDQHAAKILASLRHEGTGLVQERDGRNMRVKFFRITPQQVSEIARKYGPMKPGPEDVLAHALGEEYETRWDRFRTTRKAAVRASRPAPDVPAPRPRPGRPRAPTPQPHPAAQPAHYPHPSPPPAGSTYGQPSPTPARSSTPPAGPVPPPSPSPARPPSGRPPATPPLWPYANPSPASSAAGPGYPPPVHDHPAQAPGQGARRPAPGGPPGPHAAPPSQGGFGHPPAAAPDQAVFGHPPAAAPPGRFGGPPMEPPPGLFSRTPGPASLGTPTHLPPGDPAAALRQRVRDYIGRNGERGVTFKMVVALLDTEHAGVDEHTIRRWLAEDVNRQLMERSPRGIYRIRQAS
jgi:S-DNA-T family DNA segregation ATPase FtsK/SpoIIIE